MDFLKEELREKRSHLFKTIAAARSRLDESLRILRAKEYSETSSDEELEHWRHNVECASRSLRQSKDILETFESQLESADMASAEAKSLDQEFGEIEF